MKIISFNTQHCNNYIEQKIDFDIMADAIKKCDADIVGLNEMRDKGNDVEYEAQTAILSKLTGLKYHYFAKAIEFSGGNPYGNAFCQNIRSRVQKRYSFPTRTPKQETNTTRRAVF